MLGREPTPIPFSTEALRASLLRLEKEWETFQATRDRDAIYGYLTAVFETVMAWTLEGRAVDRAHRALHLRGHSIQRSQNPSRPSFVARLIRQRLMTAREANGPVCCGTRRNTRIWMSRCGTLSSAKVASTNARRGLLRVWDDTNHRLILFDRDESVLCTPSIDFADDHPPKCSTAVNGI